MPTLSQALLRLLCKLAFFGFFVGVLSISTEARPSSPPPEPQELILLLEPGDPRPEFVVQEVNGGRAAPAGLGEGNPKAARLAIANRAWGSRKAFHDAHPDTPAARLQRYVIFRYPENVNLDAIATALGNNPRVEHVERNRYLTLSAATAPSRGLSEKATIGDPLLDPAPAVPEQYQWGHHLLRLPEAWELTRGHAQIGMVDRGTQENHPDLRAFRRDADGNLVFEGGSFREHLSEDLFFEDCSVDELDPDDGVSRIYAGHGVHVAGILAATTFNDLGVAGSCPNCSLQVMKALDSSGSRDAQMLMDRAYASIEELTRNGAAAINLSFGIQQEPCTIDPVNLSFFCQTMDFAASRDVVLVGASGNARTDVQFPANSPQVIAAGGLAFRATGSGYSFWDDCPSGDLEQCDCPLEYLGWEFSECGSNSGPEQELAAPAKTVISTIYEGYDHNRDIRCGDSFLSQELEDGTDIYEGYGPCTGTSMASPFVTGVAGLVRSANPLLDAEEVRDVLSSTASSASQRTERLGYGVPDAVAAVERALGTWRGVTAPNRLTPLFSLYSTVDTTHAFVSSPVTAIAFLLEDSDTDFGSVGPLVPGYDAFPGLECIVSPCDASQQPRASFFVFTTEKNPDSTSGRPLVPLYRVRYDQNIPNRCVSPEPEHIPARDFAYTTTEAGIIHFHESTVDADGVGYELEGVEGYIYERCDAASEPECIPGGAEKIYRYYHANRDDYAIFPESELAQWEAQGYTPPGGALADVLGYAYPNVDSDGDGLIDGWELLIGTDPDTVDSDCDGLGDGEETLRYRDSGSPEEHGFSDPLIGPCGSDIFEDGFEAGDTSRWSFTS